ncbi:adenosine deaminase [Acetohalobium arabaticum]|uniref:Adenosine deaminase n=1 Tax=Acetohalobium arabaticum (strain ATCC 49924 / DSM 5501 / Z-7288) TaxID=574087 RepID=D9QU55_ACEAZ|nr:adenosine deaminase [Acetohalobium arabaticum]ADL11848.1 adenosine deaminase [Acetohalobium arabaticum DSM 5501]
MEKLIRKLPKTELHLHLDGSLRVKTVLELAEDREIELPTADQKGLAEYLQVSEDCDSLAEYLEKFDLPLKVMQTEKALTRVTYELLEDAAWENVKYLEIRFAPLLLTEELRPAEVVEAVLAGVEKGENKYELQANIILCCMRHQDPSRSIETAQLAVDYSDQGVVGLDLAGDEANFPPEEHEEAFKLAAGAGLHRTVHAGETAGAKNVKKAIDYLNAERIGHGIRSKEDKETLETIKEAGVTLEICPTSNLHTNAVTDLEQHPIREYYEAGIPITVNTDNRTVSNLTLSQEYLMLYREFGFSLAEIQELILSGIKAAFISDKEQEKLITEFKSEFETIAGIDNKILE